MERGETLRSALRREVREETGLAVRIIRPVDAHIVYDSPTGRGTRVDSLRVTFLCGLRTQRVPKLSPTEHDDFVWSSPGNLRRFQMPKGQRGAIHRAFAARGR